MKTKIVALIFIPLLLGFAFTLSLEAVQITDVFENSNSQQKSESNHRIFGFGTCYGIAINGDIKQGKGRNQHLAGFIKTDLSIRNQDPIFTGCIDSIFPYFLKIKNLQTGEILTKDTLPVYVYLNNFSGIGYINDYYLSWGPTRAIFFLFGKADYIN
jgi:hypothetical protein